MSLYPLGISRRRDVPSVPKQASGSVDMRWTLEGDLACAFLDAPHEPVPPMLHASILDAIHRRICVLPVRFGAALRDESEIRDLLQVRCHDLLDSLSRLDWTCEMGLRIAAPTATSTPCPLPAPSVAPSALAYIEERRSHYRQTDGNVERDRGIVQQFVERLHGYYRQWRNLPSSPSHPVRLAFLVERNRVAGFQNRAEIARRECHDGRCAILGPWPPYSFV